MSIQTEIARLAAEGKLFCLESLLTGQETVRTLWVSQEVYDAVSWPAAGVRRLRLAEFRAFLDAFLENCRLTVAEDPDRKPGETDMARVKPVDDEFWDFRILVPERGIRAFGGFSEYNTFVLLTWEYREDILDFDAEVQRCKTEWRSLFGGIAPMRKARLNEYLSNYQAV